MRAKLEEVLERGDVQEMAEFFDRVDTEELGLEEASDVEITRPEMEQISLRLPKKDLDLLRREVRRAGIGYTTLIRMMLRERLDARGVEVKSEDNLE